jgi:hypothetical protein
LVLRTGKKVKDEFLYHLDESISDLIGKEETQEKPFPSFVSRNPRSIDANGNIITPDYSVGVGENEVAIFVSPLKYYSDELLRVRKINESGTRAEVFCLLEDKEKCPKGAMCFKEVVD